MQHKIKCIILKYCFDHVGTKNSVKVGSMLFSNCAATCVCKAVGGTHFVKDLISMVTKFTRIIIVL